MLLHKTITFIIEFHSKKSERISFLYIFFKKKFTTYVSLCEWAIHFHKSNQRKMFCFQVHLDDDHHHHRVNYRFLFDFCIHSIFVRTNKTKICSGFNKRMFVSFFTSKKMVFGYANFHSFFRTFFLPSSLLTMFDRDLIFQTFCPTLALAGCSSFRYNR